MKKLLSLTMLVLTFAGVNSFALSADDIIIREYNAKATAEQVDYNDGTLINIVYVGASTEAAVAVASGSLNTYTPIGTVDLNYNLAATAYDTLGELCDAIEAEDDYTCDMTGGKRDDSSLLLDFVTAATATDAKASGGYSITIDTGGITETDPYIMRIGITPSSGKRVVLKHCTVQNDAVGTLLVYGKLAKFQGSTDGVTRNDTTLLWSEPTANDTVENAPNSTITGSDIWMEFAKDEHVVISAGNIAEPQTATSYLRCQWDEK